MRFSPDCETPQWPPPLLPERRVLFIVEEAALPGLRAGTHAIVGMPKSAEVALILRERFRDYGKIGLLVIDDSFPICDGAVKLPDLKGSEVVECSSN